MSSAYISPLATRLQQDSEPLTLKTLAKYVPAAKASLLASDEMKADPPPTAARKRELQRLISDGEEAKEKLVIIAMPLIKSLARKEMSRRQAWNSRVVVDDIISEGLGGLMRGIRAYNVDGKHTSPTNYLGQWIVTDMRRNTEVIDHDFSVPYEAIERHRRIRAIRSRLFNELNRQPTNEEIVEAANDGSYQDRSMMGKVNKNPNATPSARRAITLKQVEEEQDLAARTGATRPVHGLGGSGGDDDDTRGVEDMAVHAVYDTDNNSQPYGIDDVDEGAAKRSLTSLIEDSFNLMNVAQTQRDIIRRRFGLLPYDTEATIDAIITQTGVPKHRINRIVTAYSAQMALKNGIFHQLVARHDADEIETMGIGWVRGVLGDFIPPVNDEVNDDLTRKFAVKGKPRHLMTNFSGSGQVAHFMCPTHRDIVFSDVYLSEDDVPPTRACPRCNLQSPRVIN